MTKKQLKKENKELKNTIDRLINGTWTEKVIIAFAHKLKYDIEKLMWYGKRNIEGELIDERI